MNKVSISNGHSVFENKHACMHLDPPMIFFKDHHEMHTCTLKTHPMNLTLVSGQFLYFMWVRKRM